MYYNEYWYIGSMRFRSLITKYNTEPLIATDLYWFLTFSIVSSSTTDSCILILDSSDVDLADYNEVISSTLSRIFSGSASANYFKIIASDSDNIFLYCANFITFSSF